MIASIFFLLSISISADYPIYQIPNLDAGNSREADIIALENKVNDLTQEITELKKILNQLVGEINSLQVIVNQSKKNPPTANNKPKRKPSDPNYVHTIPQGDSYFVGNPNAKVTITEFFDFQ